MITPPYLLPTTKTCDPILTIAPLSDLHCYYVIPTDCWQSPFNASLGSWKVSDTTEINYWKTSFVWQWLKKKEPLKKYNFFEIFMESNVYIPCCIIQPLTLFGISLNLFCQSVKMTLYVVLSVRLSVLLSLFRLAS